MAEPTRTLAEWLDYISSQHHQEIALGLARVSEVAQRLALLPLAPRQLIVAGTNGKGPTVRFAESLLLAQGQRVGATLSPHLERYNERVRIGGEEVSDADLVKAFEAIDTARGDIPLTYYEYSVLGAFWLFKRAQLDVVLLEVGLGGRLDVTNIVDAEVAVVTSIGLDHQDLLGDTLDLIGAEKAAVCRAGAPLIVGSDMPASVVELARSRGANLLRFGEHCWYQRSKHGFSIRLNGGGLTISSGTFPGIALANVALAVAAVAQLVRPPNDAELTEAAQHCEHPGRFEVFEWLGRTVVLDVAHNAASAQFLRRQLEARFPGRRRIGCIGILADKDVEAIAAALAPALAHGVWVPTRGARGLAAEVACQRAQSVLGERRWMVEHDVHQGLETARANAGEADIIVACGSFQLVQTVRELLRQTVSTETKQPPDQKTDIK